MKSPVFIVAAGRSGSKMLRGVLASHPDMVCFPREINYIWRHGNALFPTDELRPELARPAIIQYIRGRFEKFAKANGGRRVIDKTCANALRVAYVHKVFPESIVIHLIRDGRSVAESARRRWQEPPDFSDILENLRWLPVGDIPYYGLRYFKYQLARLCSRERAQSSWGPRFAGLDELVRKKSLIEVCGLQWKTCVQAAENALQQLPPEQTLTLHYEEMVKDPAGVAELLFKRIGVEFLPVCREHVQKNIEMGNLHKWKQGISCEELELLHSCVNTEGGSHKKLNRTAKAGRIMSSS